MFQSFIARVAVALCAACCLSVPTDGFGQRVRGHVVVGHAHPVRQELRRPAQADRAKSYQTYTKTNPRDATIYVGRTSGTGSPMQNVQRRDQSHRWTQRGYGPAQLDRSSDNVEAIRGREQMVLQHNQARAVAAPQINGVSKRNPKREHYLGEAKKEFGSS